MSEETRPASTPSDEATWPAVVVAYDFVMPSYQLLVGRFEAASNRAQHMMSLAVTITLGIPMLGRAINEKATFWNAPFAAALAIFVALMIAGIIARDVGEVRLAGPNRLYERSLHLSVWEFKRDAIFFAGQHFERNKAAIKRKSDLTRAMSILLIAEVVAFVVWMARA